MLLQLPHFDYDVVKKLGRKKLRGLAELVAMDAEGRLELFVTSGQTPAHPGPLPVCPCSKVPPCGFALSVPPAAWRQRAVFSYS